MAKGKIIILTLFFVSAGCYQKNFGPRGDVIQNGTGGFWELSSCEVNGRAISLNQFPEKALLETQRKVVSNGDGLRSSVFRIGDEYRLFSFFDRSAARTDSFPALLWDFDYSKKDREDAQWFRISDDTGVMVTLHVDRPSGTTSKIQLSNVMKSDKYKPELDTMNFTYVPTGNFK
jgi:hypothetical protein